MTCLTVALEEIKELRKQLSDKGVTSQPEVKTPLTTKTISEVCSPSQDRNSAEWDSNDNISTPGSVSYGLFGNGWDTVGVLLGCIYRGKVRS